MKKWIYLTLAALTAAATAKGFSTSQNGLDRPSCLTVQGGITGSERTQEEGGPADALSKCTTECDTMASGTIVDQAEPVAKAERSAQNDCERFLVPADRSLAKERKEERVEAGVVVPRPVTERNWIFASEDADMLVSVGGVSEQNTRFVPCEQVDTLVGLKNVYLYKDVRQSGLRLAVGGYYVTFDGKPRQPVRIKCGLGFQNVEFGFSLLTTPGYGKYAPEENDFLDLRVGKSIHFGFRIFDLGFSNRSRTVEFHTGVHLMCDNYVFNDNLTIRRNGKMIVPVPLDRDYKKSKLTTAAFGIPVQVTFLPAKSLRISALLYGDLVFNAHTKYKKPKVKERLSGVNEFQCGVGAAVSYRGFGLYAKYGLTRLFRNGTGLDTHALSVGLYFGL